MSRHLTSRYISLVFKSTKNENNFCINLDHIDKIGEHIFFNVIFFTSALIT